MWFSGNCTRELKFDHSLKRHMHHQESVLKNEMLKILWVFRSKKKIPKTGQKTRTRDNYLGLAREWKKLWNIKQKSIVIDALGTIPKWLVMGPEDLEIRRQVETIQTRVLLRSAKILRRVLDTSRDLLSFIPPVKDHQPPVVWKTHIIIMIIIMMIKICPQRLGKDTRKIEN